MYRTMELVEPILQMEIKSCRVLVSPQHKSSKFYMLGGPRPLHFEKYWIFIWKDSEINQRAAKAPIIQGFAWNSIETA